MQEQNLQKNLKVNQIVPLGFGVVLFLMFGMAVVNKLNTNNLIRTAERVAHTYRVKAELEGLEKLLVDAETGQRGFLYTNSELFLGTYERAAREITADVDDLRSLINDNPAQLQRLAQTEKLIQDKLAELQETINLRQAGKESEVRSLVLSGKGKQIMDNIRDSIEQMYKVEEELLVERQKASADTERLATLISFGGTFGAIVFGILLSQFIARTIMGPIRQAANTIASSATEIAASTEQQERTANAQATSVTQTTTTMDELGVSSRQSAEQAESAAKGAKQALGLAEGGTQTVEKTLEGMTLLKQQVGAIAQQILRLSEQTGEIGSISGLVSDIANQTNMLALNAAVEAARAGEHGKGFAVVATEIRKLADQSKKSAEKINGLVQDIQNTINSTVMVTDEGTKKVQEGMEFTQDTAAAFQGVADAINTIALSGQQISLTAKQQAIAIQQVVDAMNTLSQGAAQTASSITQTRVGTRKLNEAALNLKTLV